MDRLQLVEYARECLGTPFKHQGRVVGLGLDCVGVAIHMATRAGLPVREVKGYGRQPRDGLLQKTLVDHPFLTELTSKIALLPADILLFRIKNEPQHVGICAGSTVIHGYFQSRKVVEQSLTSWKGKLVAAYRININE